MREIKLQEINNVSGGSLLGDIIHGITGSGSTPSPSQSAASIGSSLGNTIGGFFDTIFGGTNHATAGAELGGGIGSIIDAAHSTTAADISKNVGAAVTGIGQGVIDIGKNLIADVRSVFHI